MAELSSLIKKYKKHLLRGAQKSFVEASARKYDRTPKDTWGTANSWTPMVNGYDLSNSGGSYPAEASKMKLGDFITSMNSRPWIRRLEYEGHSMQAPNGMMWITVAEWNQIVGVSFQGR